MNTISDTAVADSPRLVLLPADPATPLNVRHAASLLGVSIGSVYAMVDDGSLPHFRIGPKKASIRFRRDDLDAYLSSCYVPAAAAKPSRPATVATTTFVPKHLKPRRRLRKK